MTLRWVRVRSTGSVPLTSGSRSRRSKNIRIPRIRIRNTATRYLYLTGIKGSLLNEAEMGRGEIYRIPISD